MKPKPYRREKTPGRNDKCLCGSGKKAKHCCLKKIKWFANLPPVVREQVVASKILSRPSAIKFGSGTITTESGVIPIENAEIIAIAEPLTLTAGPWKPDGPLDPNGPAGK
jgi:hypothetical protein